MDVKVNDTYVQDGLEYIVTQVNGNMFVAVPVSE